MNIIEVGSRVRTTRVITEDGGPPDALAEVLGPGFIHAVAGEEGVVLDIQRAVILNDLDDDSEAAITVQFDRTGSICTVLAMEIEAVGMSEKEER